MAKPSVRMSSYTFYLLRLILASPFRGLINWLANCSSGNKVPLTIGCVISYYPPLLFILALSLFGKIPLSRTCEDAAVIPTFCVCTKRTVMNTTDEIVKRASLVAVDRFNAILTNYTDVCEHLKVGEIILALKPELPNKSYVDYLIMLTTSPGGGKFELEVRHDLGTDKMSASDFISRTNLYKNTSHCVDDRDLKSFCYCKKQLTNWFLFYVVSSIIWIIIIIVLLNSSLIVYVTINFNRKSSRYHLS